MKKVFLMLAVCWSLCVHANTFSYLVFTNTAGTKTTFHVEGLILNVDGTNLQVTNSTGTVDLILTDLHSMEFSTVGTTALENLLNADEAVQVYSLTGASLGDYSSMQEAAKCLNAGTYVISNGSVTQTIVVK